MTSRLLPHAEWPKLAETGMAIVAATLNPETDDVVVVESDGVIVGAWSFKIIPHVEGLWIAEGERGKTSVARRLWRGMQDLAAQRGALVVMTGAGSDEVRELLDHAGATTVGAEQFYLPMKESA